MLSSLRHPSADALSAFLASTDREAREPIAAHLERCARCRASAQVLRTLERLSEAPAPAEPPDDVRRRDALARILADRVAGARVVLPTSDLATSGVRPRRITLAAIAAALAVAALGALVARPADVAATPTRGTLTLSPAMARPGERVAVRYRPAPGLAAQPWLVLRARLRAAGADEANVTDLPITRLATLRRRADGTFAGAFTLGDSIVYAALAVEDSAAHVVDDDGGRTWELLAAAPDGRPRYAALDQRAFDLLTRNWSESHATYRRMVALYPDTIRGWVWLRAMGTWIGEDRVDSVRALHRARAARFDTLLSHTARPAPEDMGMLSWYAGLGLDSAVARRWLARVLRVAPGNHFALMARRDSLLAALRHTRDARDTAVVFDSLEALLGGAPRFDREQIVAYAASRVYRSGDSARVRRWIVHEIASARDARRGAQLVAMELAAMPRWRDEGMGRLRAELARADTPSDTHRGLDETRAAERERLAERRRALLAALGSALVETGRLRAALDTLALATDAGWDPALVRVVRAASLAAGDTTTALAMAARLVVDARTDSTFADTVARSAERRLGAGAWRARLDTARALFARRMLAGGIVRVLPSALPLRDARGREHDLRALAGGRITVVAFWSRACGPSVQSLAALDRATARLERRGLRVVSIATQSGTPEEAERFLRERRLTMPTYVDPSHRTSEALGSWGLPDYFVLDAEGRLRFAVTHSLGVALAQAEALRVADEQGAATPP